jgi:hypothetical protein
MSGDPQFTKQDIQNAALRDVRSAELPSSKGSPADEAHGTVGFEEALLRHHGKRVRQAQRPDWRPAPDYLAWHAREVFEGEACHL